MLIWNVFDYHQRSFIRCLPFFWFDSAPEICSGLLDRIWVPTIVSVESLLVILELLLTAHFSRFRCLFEAHWQRSIVLSIMLISVHLLLHLLSVDTLSDWFETLGALQIEAALNLTFSLLLSSCSISVAKYILGFELGDEATVAWHVAPSLGILGHLSLLHLLDSGLLTWLAYLGAHISRVAWHSLAWSWTIVHFLSLDLNY